MTKNERIKVVGSQTNTFTQGPMPKKIPGCHAVFQVGACTPKHYCTQSIDGNLAQKIKKSSQRKRRPV